MGELCQELIGEGWVETALENHICHGRPPGLKGKLGGPSLEPAMYWAL